MSARYLILCTERSGYAGEALWWAPDRCGYTVRFDDAGRYTEAEAREIVRGLRERGERAIREDVAEALAVRVVPGSAVREATVGEL